MFRSIAVAFSTFSIIPMPVFEWKEEDMRYSMCAFPLVGVVTGALMAGALWVLNKAGAGRMLIAGLMTLIPLFLTGGIHMDGYMDTSDALCSYGDKEKKLDILKDPHVGAFAVIRAASYILFSFVLWNELITRVLGGTATMNLFYLICCGFVISRLLSAIASFAFKKAKDDGMLHDMSKAADSKCLRILIVMSVVAAVLMIVFFRAYAIVSLIPSVLVFAYYRWVSYSKFGGITGDLAGWFLQKCELYILLCAAACAMFLK